MKKRYLSFVLAALMLGLLLGPMTLSSFGEEIVSFENKNVKNADGITVLVHGGFPLEFDTPIKISEGRTLVPLRKIAEAFHYNVEYDEKTKTIVLNRYESFIRMVLGDNSVFVSNSMDLEEGYFIMERQPDVYEGRTYVPLRAIGELFRCHVFWNPKTKTINIIGVIGAGGNEELESVAGQLPAYYYNGQIFEEKPSGNGFLRFGYEMASYYRGEFLKGIPSGNGVMRYVTGLREFNIMGRFKEGKLEEGSVLSGTKFSFIKDGKVTASYAVRNGGFVKEPNDAGLSEEWINGLQSAVSVFKK